MRNLFVKKIVFLAVALLVVLTGLALAADQQEIPSQDPNAHPKKAISYHLTDNNLLN
jgi:hypothetical protein